ncbi:MAG: hypothetical protein N838_14265 [Thiohalocapsa sp. PB-PSB1]|nr:MAG: hypothetical protein N838_14265 [Thiohalocapsa sp. PB-PSB1]
MHACKAVQVVRELALHKISTTGYTEIMTLILAKT